ncbi:MAG: biotin synthase BioB [Archangium sp.]|nr:biotin synthase BioB [Archangium sp.]MDP3157175.1 biotin synthase BioB [Archangium sp.]MDP3575505.1 biotin synthase BioB [Archangium sp.]
MSTTGFTGHAHTAHEPAHVHTEIPLRHDWTVAETRALYELPLLELVYRAQSVHRSVWKDNKVQLCSLLSIKTGGCPEDCGYCPQAARYQTGVKAEKLMAVPEVLEAAKTAREAGATRFCMGAAWREVKDGPQFDSVIEMVKGVKTLGMEACCTLGMVTDSQAKRLKDAGLDAYNHNLDTSEGHYGDIISTRTYDDRLKTLARVRNAGIGVCCGGIIGLGESIDDRCHMMVTLANQPQHPESVPVNALVPVKGTPLADNERVDSLEMVRTIAVARILMPASMVRLSAGRSQMNEEAQLLCMMAGANSVFFGDKLLTTGNPEYEQDMSLFERAGLKPLEPNVDKPQQQ